MPYSFTVWLTNVIRRPLLTVFILAFLVRVVFVLTLGPEPVRPLRDQMLYLRLADSIASGEGLRLEARVPGMVPEEHQWKIRVHELWVSPEEPGLGVTPPGKPTAIIEPLYPLVLGIGSLLWGDSLVLPRLLQVLLGAFTAVLAAGIMLRIGKTASYVVGIAVAIYPHLVYYTGIIATETLYIFFQMLMIFTWVRLVNRPTIIRALLFGATAGAAFLTRSSILPIFCIAVFLIILYRSSIIRSILFSILGFIIITSPWVIRNGNAVESYRLMPTKGGLNLWMQNHPEIQQLQLERIGTPIPPHILETLSCRELESFPSFADSIPEIERDRILTRRAIRYISCNPRYFMYMCWLRFKWYLRPTGSSVRGTFVDMTGVVSFALLCLFGTVGIWVGRKQAVIQLVGLAYLAYLVAHTIFHGGVRYRLPADSIFLLSAAGAVDHLVHTLRARYRG